MEELLGGILECLCSPFCECFCEPFCECFCDYCFSKNRNNIGATATENSTSLPVISEIIERPEGISNALLMETPINKDRDLEEAKTHKRIKSDTSLDKKPAATIRRCVSI